MHKDRVSKISPGNLTQVEAFLEEQWGFPIIGLPTRAYILTDLEGYIIECDDKLVAVATYKLEPPRCELVSLNSLVENRGYGTTLLRTIENVAKDAGCKRLELATSNDNLRAISFYTKQGYRMAAIHLNAIEAARKLKPQIPIIGQHGIQLRDTIEFARDL